MNHTSNLLNASSHHHSLFSFLPVFFLPLCLSLFPLSLSTFLLPHKSSLPLSALLPLLTLCHIALSHSHSFFRSLITTHTLYLNLSPLSFFNLYLPPYTSFFTLDFYILLLHSCFGPHWDHPFAPVLSIILYWSIHHIARTLLVHSSTSQQPHSCSQQLAHRSRNVQPQSLVPNVARHLKLCCKYPGKFSQRQFPFDGNYYKVLNI